MASLRRVFAAALLVTACADTKDIKSTVEDPSTDPDGGSSQDSCAKGADVICDGDVAVVCEDGSEGQRTDCAKVNQVCVKNLGCAACEPDTYECENNSSRHCSDEGAWEAPVACMNGCASDGECKTSLCDKAAESSSYIGCDYWAVTTANAQLDASFEPAIVVANPQEVAAEVMVTHGGASVGNATVQPGQIATIKLPWVDALKGDFQAGETSALVRGGAYHVVSSVPVTVYQFNPLEYQGTCKDPLFGTETECFSYSNDASLLIPTHVMTGNYIVQSRAASLMDAVTIDPFFGTETVRPMKSPGFFTVVGAENKATQVSIKFSSSVTASSDGSVQAFTAGQTGTFTLNQGDVLQILTGYPSSCARMPGAGIPNGLATLHPCEVGPGFDLTGSIIEADGKVGVFGGHSCALIPDHKMACDHLEEMLFPLETWGKDFIFSVSEELRPGEPNFVRLVSATDANQVTFEPASVHAPVTLNRGQTVEFAATQDFRIVATMPVMVGQFLVGQNYTGDALPAESVGDPSFSLAIPTEQYRSSYTFLAPTTYERNYVNVVAPKGVTVMLDGTAVSGFEELAGTDFQVARVSIQGGQHNMTSDSPFGISVYGFGAYTSYMYPGGLDLEVINPDPL